MIARELRQLTELHLEGTAITDEGLKCLTDLKKLKSLEVDDTKANWEMAQAVLDRCAGARNRRNSCGELSDSSSDGWSEDSCGAEPFAPCLIN